MSVYDEFGEIGLPAEFTDNQKTRKVGLLTQKERTVANLIPYSVFVERPVRHHNLSSFLAIPPLFGGLVFGAVAFIHGDISNTFATNVAIFASGYTIGLWVHFEMCRDYLDRKQREYVERFPYVSIDTSTQEPPPPAVTVRAQARTNAPSDLSRLFDDYQWRVLATMYGEGDESRFTRDFLAEINQANAAQNPGYDPPFKNVSSIYGTIAATLAARGLLRQSGGVYHWTSTARDFFETNGYGEYLPGRGWDSGDSPTENSPQLPRRDSSSGEID